MNTSTNAFIYGMTQSIGDTAVAYSLTAARWGVLGYSALTSPEAQRCYRVAGQYLRATALFFYGLGIISRRAVQAWVDAQVEGATPKALPPAAETVEVEVAIAITDPEVDPFSPEVNPLPAAAPSLERMTIRQLKAAARGKVPGYGRMTSQQLREALRAA